MSDNAQVTGSQASSGTSTDSTNSTEPKGARVRASLPEQFAQLQSVASKSTDPDVAHDLAQAESCYAMFQGAAADKPKASESRTVVSQTRKGSVKPLRRAVVNMQRAIRMVEGGKGFVKSSRGKNYAETAENIRTRITPDLLAHNQPLLDVMNAELQRYLENTAAYEQARSEVSTALKSAEVATRAFALSLTSLRAAIKREAVQRALAGLVPPSPAAKPKIAA